MLIKRFLKSFHFSGLNYKSYCPLPALHLPDLKGGFMSFGRQLYNFFLAASTAHARWDLEVSTSILKNRKKMLLLLALAAPVFLVCIAEAAFDPREILGGHSAYAPSFNTTPIFLAAIGVGIAAGLITGCIGAGGGFIITPALMAVGVKGILAVGTDLFHIFAKAIMGTTIHRKLGNISVKLALVFLCGSLIGTIIGGAINKGLYDTNPLLSDLFISTIYALLLGFLGFYSLWDYLRARKSPETKNAEKELSALSAHVQNLKIPPMIRFDENFVQGGRRISSWIVACGGMIVGMLAAMMGVGGGFVTFPMFVYVFGVSSMTAVGTDIFQIIFTAGFAAIGQYAIYGYVFYSLAIGMLLGSLLGIQIGALITAYAPANQIKGFYAISILSGFINRGATLPKKLVQLEAISLPSWLVNFIEQAGNVIFWIVIIWFSVWVVGNFIKQVNKPRKEGA